MRFRGNVNPHTLSILKLPERFKIYWMSQTIDQINSRDKPRIIFLLGFMGSGKTYWGENWSRHAGWGFIDLDKQIEEREGKSVADIFESRGEAYFRNLESETLRNIDPAGDTIIACGGGTPCFGDNLDWMKSRGATIYLSTTPLEIMKRVEDEIAQRPLLKKLNKAELLFFIETKLKEREQFYNRAGMIVQVSELDKGSIDSIIRKSFH